MARKRKFGGKYYTLRLRAKTKSLAKSHASHGRKQGYLVRVVKVESDKKFPWHIYGRGGR